MDEGKGIPIVSPGDAASLSTVRIAKRRSALPAAADRRSGLIFSATIECPAVRFPSARHLYPA
jgi:hypothetical protein